MKNLLILFLLNFTLFAANIDEFAKEMDILRDYDSALSKAKKENKVLVMIMSADSCPWCRKFENKTLKSSLVKPHLNTEVISLLVDKKYDKESYPSKFTTSFTPRVFFINPHNEKILTQSAGYIKKKEFLKYLNNAKQLFKAVK